MSPRYSQSHPTNAYFGDIQIKIVLRSLENFSVNAYFALVISIIIGIGGQLSLKAGAMQGIGTKLFLFQPYILVGLSSYFVAALFYIFALRDIPVSVAFPSVSISYVAVAFLAHLIWEVDLLKRLFHLAQQPVHFISQ